MNVMIDLDGVLVNFIEAACNEFGVDYVETMAKWTPGSWDMAEALGISSSKFYKTIEAQGVEFWVNCKAYPWADELWDICEKKAPTFILTTPTYDSKCVAGKVQWLQNWKGYDFRKYAITPFKSLCAKGNLLIDDREENVDGFTEAGGIGILFPAHTNRDWKLKDQAFEVVKERLNNV